MATTKPEFDFRRGKTVPLEKPKQSSGNQSTATVTARGKNKTEKTAPASPVVRPGKSAVKTTAVTKTTSSAVAVRTLPPSRMSATLTSMVEKATVGDFRGRKPRPDLVISSTEMQALQQCLAMFQEPIPETKTPARAEKAGKGKKKVA